MTCAMRLVARMADDMGINIQVGRYSTVSINLSNILEFYLLVVEKLFLHARGAKLRHLDAFLRFCVLGCILQTFVFYVFLMWGHK